VTLSAMGLTAASALIDEDLEQVIANAETAGSPRSRPAALGRPLRSFGSHRNGRDLRPRGGTSVRRGAAVSMDRATLRAFKGPRRRSRRVISPNCETSIPSFSRV